MAALGCVHSDVRQPSAEQVKLSANAPSAAPLPKTAFAPVNTRPTLPQVKLGSPTLHGVSGKDIVRTVVLRSEEQLRACYATSLLKEPSLAGQLTVQFLISVSGAVAFSKSEGELADSELLSCVDMVFRRMMFPPPEKAIKVDIPLTFIAPERAAEVQPRP